MQPLKAHFFVYRIVRTKCAEKLKRWQSKAVSATTEVARHDLRSKFVSRQSALFAPTGDAEGGKSVIFAVQPYVDLQWLLHDSEEQFGTNLRRRGYDPNKYPHRAALLHDAKLLSRLHSERADTKQQQQHIANEMARLKQSLIEKQESAVKTDVADEQTRNYAQTMREEGLRLRSIAKDQAAQISVLEQAVILPALSLPNRLAAENVDSPVSDADGAPYLANCKVVHERRNSEMRCTSPSPYMRGLPAEAELWLQNMVLNNLINEHSFIPLSPPSLYQAVVAEGCTAIDLLTTKDAVSGGESSANQSPAYAVLFPPTLEQSHKVHETRATYLLCHPCMPMSAFLANVEIPTVSLPAKLAWSARMHLSAPLSRHYKNLLFSQPNVVGWTELFASTADNHDMLNKMLQTVRDLVLKGIQNMHIQITEAELHWSTAPANELFNDEMLRYCLMFSTKEHGDLELARCSLGGTFISKRLKILHALDKPDKKANGGHVKRNFPADYGFLECNYGMINLSHIASLCPSAVVKT